jgi:hypothetical protein
MSIYGGPFLEALQHRFGQATLREGNAGPADTDGEGGGKSE